MIIWPNLRMRNEKSEALSHDATSSNDPWEAVLVFKPRAQGDHCVTCLFVAASGNPLPDAQDFACGDMGNRGTVHFFHRFQLYFSFLILKNHSELMADISEIRANRGKKPTHNNTFISQSLYLGIFFQTFSLWNKILVWNYIAQFDFKGESWLWSETVSCKYKHLKREMSIS